MSKIKRALPEDFDVTDPRDTGFVDVEMQVSMALWDITKSIALLQKYPDEAYESRDELITHATALTALSERE